MKLNFQNTWTWTKNKTISINNTFENQGISNVLAVVFKQNAQNYILFNVDYFLPNLITPSNNYWFLDLEYRYKFKKPVDLSIYCKNLFNQRYFEQIETSDFAILTYRTNLLPRYFMISVSCNF
ncbi:TonB-dependent receptor [Raineya orbicola]|jgi:outer membrane receptor for ferrienterochelin and colicin|uniref:TonB dependent receptor n=1 Tax=Raineya orbicola TaxID=2016530 RepID=A0A2N3IJG2_9BACT|nr:TonB-dependent receptor [Raineya orbicola]PKQ70480.1 TonB dependent receptor [Raineya orbicola]